MSALFENTFGLIGNRVFRRSDRSRSAVDDLDPVSIVKIYDEGSV